MSFVLLQVVAIPLLAAPIAYFLGRRVAMAGSLSAIALGYVVVVALTASLARGGLEFYEWYPIGFFGLRADGLSMPFLLTISILTFLISIYSVPYIARKPESRSTAGTYYALYLLFAMGMLGTVLSTNLIQFYIFFEVMLIPSYLLIAKWGYGEREQMSITYFLWTHAGALTLLAGILATGFLGGSFDLFAPSGLPVIDPSKITADLRTWIALAIVLGLLVKMAITGFHVWLPYAHAEAPTPVGALLSAAMMGIGAYGIVRIVDLVIPSAMKTLGFGMTIWALVTIIYGGIMALAQDDIRRLLAYSSMSQMGYILFGIATLEPIGVAGSIFHYVSHGTGKGILFMAAGAIILQAGGLRNISGMGGLAARMPVTATAATIGFLAIMGIPPMNGFISEIMIFLGAFKASLIGKSLVGIIIAILALLGTMVTAAYSLWTIKRVFFGQLPDGLKDVTEPPMAVTAPLMVLAALTVLLGVYPEFIVGLLVPYVKQLLGA